MPLHLGRRWTAALVCALAPPLSAQGPNDATVYRDVHGVPHIEAQTEEAAWYAMGHEQARDALYWIQVNVKKMRGESAAHLTCASPNSQILNDLIVQTVQTSLRNTPESELRSMFRIDSLPNPDQVYDNVAAYTRGINDYRDALRTGNVAPNELAARDWILSLNHDWALNDAIEPGDVLSYGSWFNAILQWGLASRVDPTPLPFDICTLQHLDELSDQIASISGLPNPMPHMKALMSEMGAGGSNSWGWSYPYQLEDGRPVAGCVGDPHQLGVGNTLIYPGTPDDCSDLLHVWYCHLKVDHVDDSRDLDTFGYVQHPLGMMFLSHNRHVAFGGSVGSPNVSDAFLLRLRTDDNGSIVQPLQYYSYDHDEAGTNGEGGPNDPSWQTFVKETITINRLGQGPVTQDILRAGEFGFVVNHTPYYSEVAEDQRWQLGSDGSNEFHPDPGPNRIPVLTTYRLPVDPNVDGTRHRRLVAAMYQWMRAESVYDVAETVQNLDAEFMVNFVAVDRDGRVFATNLGNCPQRGDHEAMRAECYNSFPDKWDAYEKGEREPVPARFLADKMFDWQRDDAGQIKYLEIDEEGGPQNPQFKPFTIYDPKGGLFYPPITSGPDNLDIENPGFASMTNDFVFYAFEKNSGVAIDKYPDELDDDCTTRDFNRYLFPENRLLNDLMESGTMDYSFVFGFEANDRTRHTIDSFMDVTRYFLNESPSRPPRNRQETLELAQDPSLYIERDYSWPSDSVATPDAYLGLPASIRTMRELVDHLDMPPVPDALSVLEQFQREAAFFHDLWTALYEPDPDTDWLDLNLKSAWVENASQGVWWYPNADDEDPQPAWIPMPPELGLIDFLWNESLPGTFDLDADVYTALTVDERADLEAAVNFLVTWDASAPESRYRMEGSSRAAALLREFRASFGADGEVWGRSVVPLFNGTIMEDDGEIPDLCNPTFELHPLSDLGRLPSISRILCNLRPSYQSLQTVAFPIDPKSSALFGSGTLGGSLTPPYDALYEDQTQRAVRARLDPEHINAFVQFFLELGGFWIGPDACESGNPSSKLITHTLLPKCSTNGLLQFEALRAAYRPGYPMTQGMARVATLRRLAHTMAYVDEQFGGTPFMDEISRARIFDPTGTQRFPTTGDSVPCEPAGSLRAVDQGGDAATFGERKAAEARGPQPQFFSYGGSARILVTLFPQATEAEEPLPPESYFWALPGQRLMHFDSAHFADHMPAYTSRDLMTTHFLDYAQNLSQATNEFPVNPYILTKPNSP